MAADEPNDPRVDVVIEASEETAALLMKGGMLTTNDILHRIGMKLVAMSLDPSTVGAPLRQDFGVRIRVDLEVTK